MRSLRSQRLCRSVHILTQYFGRNFANKQQDKRGDGSVRQSWTFLRNDPSIHILMCIYACMYICIVAKHMCSVNWDKRICPTECAVGWPNLSQIGPTSEPIFRAYVFCIRSRDRKSSCTIFSEDKKMPTDKPWCGKKRSDARFWNYSDSPVFLWVFGKCIHHTCCLR